jgi:CPA1 family monovalent cation:H+ antiporter
MVALLTQQTLVAADETSGLLEAELSVVILLTIGALVAMLVRRIKVPYTVALVLMGLLLSFFPDFLQLEISKDLILAVLVPPLIFEATLHIPWRRLRADLAPILSFAVFGTLLGTVATAALAVQFVDVEWAAAIAFGALISATDPVAVIAFFRTLGVSKRLSILVEGESLFNDGVAIVVFTIATGLGVAGEFVLSDALAEFAIVAFGGLAVGAILGYVVSNVILRNLDDHLIETAVTVALAFGSFLVAEEFGLIIGVDGLHLSGILAVVAAGLMVGNIGFHNTSPTTRLTLENFWEFLSFIVNSLVFLLLGLRIDIGQTTSNLGAILVAIAAILVTRLVIVYGFTALHNGWRPNRRISTGFQHVMFWGGLRGAISLALALTLGEFFDDRTTEVLQVMTFGVVLFTLLIQGTTISPLIRRLGLSQKSEHVVEQQEVQATIYSKRAGRRALERLNREGVLDPALFKSLDEIYEVELAEQRGELSQHFRDYPELETAMFLQARAEAINAERSAVLDAARRGLISSDIAEEQTVALNNRLAALEFLESRLEHKGSLPDPGALPIEPTE